MPQLTRFFLPALIVLSLFAGDSFAQEFRRRNFPTALEYSFPLQPSAPPYNSSMLLEVFLTYYFTDSIARNVHDSTINNFFDTLSSEFIFKSAAKYLYHTTDYDPIRWYQWWSTSPGVMPGDTTSPYKSSPSKWRKAFLQSLITKIPDTLRTAQLVWSDYIMHVMVTDTTTYDDSTAYDRYDMVRVKAQIVDTIKGRNFHDHCIEMVNETKGDRTSSVSSACLDFQYRTSWRRLRPNKKSYDDNATLVDPLGVKWVEENKQYIVFLEYLDYGRDILFNYAGLRPTMVGSTMGGMYPIVGGFVQDPNNDFGFGGPLTVAQFKAALRARIDQLKN